MKFNLLLSLSSLLVTWSTLAAAADINLGYHNWTGTEEAKLSIKPDGDTIQIRIKIEGEARCSFYRKDLCDREVSLVNIELQKGQCTIIAPTLLNCRIDSFDNAVVTAVLTDGKTISLDQIQGVVAVAQTTSLIEAHDGHFNTETHGSLDIQIWGDRADGLDPLIQTVGPSLFGGGGAFVDPVSVSLF